MQSATQPAETIVALSTPPGVGAIGVIRLSGSKAIEIADELSPGLNLAAKAGRTLHFARLEHKGLPVDEVVLALYRAPKSYTGEDVVEISCHGSPFILKQVLEACVQTGARMAKPGEFTQRAFLNGKMDLAQAEAVADVIAAESAAAQQAALNQLRGGFSGDLKALRESLIHFAALIELELDFSQEDVEFADRGQLQNLVNNLTATTRSMLDSFKLGNVLKNGVSVAIVGKPNAGKSTLLNALLNEERAIVSAIAGTTRDTIEETLNINGVLFRLIDTAGIREHSTDEIEQIGMGRSLEKMRQADVVIYLFDASHTTEAELKQQQSSMDAEGLKYLLVANKTDTLSHAEVAARFDTIEPKPLLISAKQRLHIDELKKALYDRVMSGMVQTENSIVTNARHYEALQQMAASLSDIQTALEQQVSGDFLAIDIRRCLYYIGTITGQVEIDRDILGTIFGKFCIGK